MYSSYMFPKGDLVPLCQEDICRGPAEYGDCALQPDHSFLHQPSAGDVVCVAVGVYYTERGKNTWFKAQDLGIILNYYV